MAMSGTTPDDRAARRRPFTTWVRRLTHFKGASAAATATTTGPKRHLAPIKIASKKRASKKNNPYPLSGCAPVTYDSDGVAGSRTSYTTSPGMSASAASLGRRRSSSVETADDDGADDVHDDGDDDDNDDSDRDSRAPPTTGARSMAPTVSTEQDGPRSVLAPSNGAASSVTGTTSRTATVGHGSRRGGDSTFSSPAPSLQSLATTLTTIQSLGGGHASVTGHNNHAGASVGFGATVLFHQPFPSTPASAIPSHLTPATAGPTGHPTTYSAATANNLLTDNASILTLASSSKRRRRRSLDTDASVRALAPSSLFGGSRESLPLSVLSASVEPSANTASSRVSISAAAAASASATERTSLYSASGILGDRSSYYARQALAGATTATAVSTATGGQGDGASVRSGRSGRSGRSVPGHARAESLGGSMASPLASPMEAAEPVMELQSETPLAEAMVAMPKVGKMGKTTCKAK